MSVQERLSKFRINVRLSVQHKCPLLSLRWYQMLVPEELLGFAASADSRRRCISLPSLCGFPTPSPSVEWTSPEAWPAAPPRELHSEHRPHDWQRCQYCCEVAHGDWGGLPGLSRFGDARPTVQTAPMRRNLELRLSQGEERSGRTQRRIWVRRCVDLDGHRCGHKTCSVLARGKS